MKHTPGPWEINERMPINIYSKGRGTIANMVITNHIGMEARKANARLIAQTPTMLSDLQYIDYAIGAELEDSLDDDDVIEIDITVKAARDIRALVRKIEKEGE